MEQTRKLNGKVAIIAGGTGGIGAAAAHMLAEQGASVIIGYHRNADKAAAIVAGLPGQGHGELQLTIEDSASVQAFRDRVSAVWGRADILVNAAGVTTPIPHRDLDALSDELIDGIFAANVRGPFALIRALTPLLRASGDAVIINVSSISGFTGGGSNIAYCAAKGALDTMTLSLARALGPEIRVLAVSPGAVATDFVSGRGRQELATIAERTPLKRIVEPEDVALAIIACVTHLGSSTGSRIVVDGGRFLV